MADNELTRILADLARTQAVNTRPNFNQVSGLSKAILSGAGLQKPYESTKLPNKKDIRGPSFVNRVLDVLSRPLYAAMNMTKGSVERARGRGIEGAVSESLKSLSPITSTDVMGDIWGGLSGKEKTTGKDIVTLGEQQAGGKLPGPAKAALGFGLDVFGDPLTYTGIGLLPKIGKTAKVSTEALAELERGVGKTAQNITEEISKKAARQAQDLNLPITPVKGAPAPPIGAPPRLFAAGAGPNLSAEELAAKIAAPKKRIPIAAIEAGPAKVATPAPLDILMETIRSGKKGMSEISAAARKFPVNANPVQAIKVLEEHIKGAKSQVIKKLLRKEAEKIRAGINPADILSRARTTPPAFPALTVNQRWIDSAIGVADSFLKSNRMKNINHVGQTNLYNRILNAANKVRKEQRPAHVLQMLRIAEEQILKAGRHLTDAEGLSVRLSDVANISGGARALTPRLVDDFRKARPSQQIEDLKTYTTPQVASEILDPVIKTGAQVADAAKNLPPSQTVQIGSKISEELKRLAERAGASTREATTAKAFIDDLFSVERDKLYTSIQNEARNLVRQTSTGIVNPQTLHKISEATYKSLGSNPKVLGRELQQKQVVEGIMTKFATWWGAKDLKPFSREYIDTARNVAAAFSETMTPLVRATKPSERIAAFSVAQGKVSANSAKEAALANQFKYLVERLMGTHGITGNSEAVVLRSGTVMKELNKELPSELQFISGKGTTKLGVPYDYSRGTWMHSWKEWQVKEPAEALYQLTRAMQMVTRKNSMWDDAAVRWGLPTKGAEFQHQAAGIERLKGMYFPEQIANQLSNLQSQLERDILRTPHKAVALFDQVQRMWKTGVTIYSPSHHIRNLNGDVYLAALDGVVSPKPYMIATKVLHAFPTRHRDLESVFKIMDPGLRDKALRARPGNVVLTTRAGEKVTAQQLYEAAESQGIFTRAVDLEDLATSAQTPTFGSLGNKFQPFGGRVHGAATRTSELRDHWVRLAHFADVVRKSKAPLRVAIEQAGRRVKKFHPDGSDLTGFEQNILRRAIPFYSWMRKATPLVLEGAIMRPHITMAFPKAMANMQSVTGIESEGPGDPFPMDQMFPEWIKEKGIGPILQPGSGLGRSENWRGEAPGYTVINPTQPFMDQIAQVGSPGKTIISSLTPAARIPIELLTGETSLGIPLESVEGGTPGHLAQQIPAVGIAARLSGATRSHEPWNPEQLLNWLTSIGLTGTGPYQGQSQVEIREVLAELAKQNRGNYR